MIGKFQKGGKQNPKQDAVMQFVQELAKTLQADPQQFVQVAQQNPDALQAAVEAYQQTQDIGQAAQAFKQIVQQKTQAAKHGTKLQYLKSLKHQCSEDEEVVYYKQGGSVNCGCVKKGQSGTEMPKNNPVKKFKERNQQPPKEQTYDQKTGKMRAATKEEIEQRKKNRQDAAKGKGEGTPQRKKGGNIEKDCGGSAVARFKAKCGAKVKKHEYGGSLKSIPFYQGGTSKGGLPTAPPAEQRFKNGRIVTKDDELINNRIQFVNSSQVDGVYANTPYSIIPASIIRTINGNDTTIMETPEQKRFAFRLPPKVRKASSKDEDRTEFDILNRRFNTAMSVAKKK